MACQGEANGRGLPGSPCLAAGGLLLKAGGATEGRPLITAEWTDLLGKALSGGLAARAAGGYVLAMEEWAVSCRAAHNT